MKRIFLLFIGLLSGLLPLYGAELVAYQGAKQAHTESYALRVGQRQFNLETLQTLPRYSVHLRTLWSDESTFVGVKLTDLLSAAEIESFRLLYLEAKNDYAVTLTGHEASFDSALIAYQKDGVLLPIQDKGPFWLIWPSLEEKLLSRLDNGAIWIWNLKSIKKVK